MNRIINNIEELRGIGFPVNKIEPAKLFAFIAEAELLYIKPILGDEFYMKIVNDKETYNDVLEGAMWTDEDGVIHYTEGLKCALTYFIHAQNLMSGDINATRYGNVLKDNEYSTHISSKERSDAYNNALEIGKTYINEIVNYCKFKGYITKKGRSKVVGSLRIRRIGN